MTREIPVQNLLGTRFLVRIATAEIQQRIRPQNKISFADMKALPDGYLLTYDTKKRTLANAESKVNNIKQIELPMMVRLDPRGMSERYRIPVRMLKGKTDMEVLENDYLFKSRLAGVLPQIRIGMDDYFVSLTDMKLHRMDQRREIDLSKLDYSESEQCFRCYFNTKTGTVVQIDPTIQEYPKDVAHLVLPRLELLDPVAMAQLFGLSDSALLLRFPIREHLKARTIQLGETPLKSLIESNRLGITANKMRGR